MYKVSANSCSPSLNSMMLEGSKHKYIQPQPIRGCLSKPCKDRRHNQCYKLTCNCGCHKRQ